MTARKAATAMPRTPAFVSRDVGAAELCVSVATWDRWVVSGQLPKPVAGFPGDLPRWRWADVEAALVGQPPVGGALASACSDATVDPFVAAAGNFRNASQKGRRRG